VRYPGRPGPSAQVWRLTRYDRSGRLGPAWPAGGGAYRLDIIWVAFVAVNLAAMRLLPEWQTVPFLAIWVSLTVIYGLRLWRLQPTILTVHDREDECFYVLDGELSIRCGGDAVDAPAGSFVFLPRGRPHRFWAKDQPARLLLITIPGGIEDYFRRINNASSDEERDQIGEQYSIRVVPE
jgi:mannose-6-phosphate isomerase-like protein (cupin superfamily)